MLKLKDHNCNKTRELELELELELSLISFLRLLVQLKKNVDDMFFGCYVNDT